MDETINIPPEHVEIVTPGGTLRVVYEMTVGDLLVSSMILLVVVLLLLITVLKISWRR